MLMLELPSDPKFPVGKTVITQGLFFALLDAGLDELEIGGKLSRLLQQHVNLEQGLLCDEDHKSNLRAVRDGERVFSSFDLKGTKVWIITEWDRSYTTMLLPQDY